MKFFIKKLGCPKNDVDGDFIAGKLIEQGHVLTGDDRQAEIVIVNTCGFILPAKEESIQEILHYEKLKNEGRVKRLYITGCLSQRYGDELNSDIKGADGFFGLGKIEELVRTIDNSGISANRVRRDNAADLTYLAGDVRYVDNTYPYEYLKIAEGCDRFCAYCAIPYIRGRYRSRTIQDVVDEAGFLAARGKKEIILVSQEGTGYGRDFNDGTDILNLMRELEKIEGIAWIRLMYLHPESIDDRLISYMSASEKVLGYFDVPLQHISDRLLLKMNRRAGRREIERLLLKIREASPENIIRTTFIAGLPGETSGDFEELRDFIEDFEFDRLGVFKYSPEEGTKAVEFGERVSDKVASERQDILMNLQQQIAFKKNIALIDKTRKVIIDEVSPDSRAIGRTKGDCPDIDQLIYVTDGNLQSGDIVRVRIVMAEGYDLIARVEGS